MPLFDVEFEGSVSVEADNDEQAEFFVEKKLNDAEILLFNITAINEVED